VTNVQIIAWALVALLIALSFLAIVGYREWRVRRLPGGRGVMYAPRPQPAPSSGAARASGPPEPEALRLDGGGGAGVVGPEPEPRRPAPAPEPETHAEAGIEVGDVEEAPAPLAEIEAEPGPEPESVTGDPLALRPPPAPFVGREVLRKELLHALRTSERRAVTIHTTGEGVGARSLARLIASDVAGEFPGPRLQIDLASEAGAHGAMRRVVRALSPGSDAGADGATIEALYRGALGGERGVLTLLDAEDADRVEGLLPPPGWACVVVSRGRRMIDGAGARRVDPLPRADAAALARTFAPGRAELHGAAGERLAELAGGLPLAVELAARPLGARADLAVSEHLAALEGGGDGAGCPIARAVRASLETLEEGLRARFSTLSLFGGAIDASSSAAVWDLRGPDAVGQAERELERLASVGLVRWDAAARRYFMHPAVRRVAAASLGEPDKLLALRFLIRATRVLARVAELAGDDARGAARLAELEEPNLRAAETLLAGRPADPDLDRLRERLGAARDAVADGAGV
jgi:hypothetical protein